MIEYYIDGSMKGQRIGVGIVKVNEYGFIEKYHYDVEHINPTSNIAEAYSLEKALEMIKQFDLHKNEMIDIYTDCQKLYQLFLFHEKTEFTNSQYFVKQEANRYFQHIRELYIELTSEFSQYPVYHCEKTNRSRPFIKIFYQDDAKDKKYLQYAHDLSRQYLKEETKPIIVELKAKRENNSWYIIKNNKPIAENKRPILALAQALNQFDSNSKIKMSDDLITLIKNTRTMKLSNESMKKAMKVIEKYNL
ncbi:hypothetical protein HHO41_18705 [Bacillus sp. DNRA2]|uniref:hypothetical protein n=1 Tax=Bacillus sp. DNRA2 TaxID=2723053 RepID=UPI00145F67F8|nr:hypothetical protein [Bacillus sp. DNRA2]NMD72303.1 hypothetical protein [Bacillus sp. DNRA2]